MIIDANVSRHIDTINQLLVNQNRFTDATCSGLERSMQLSELGSALNPKFTAELIGHSVFNVGFLLHGRYRHDLLPRKHVLSSFEPVLTQSSVHREV